MTVYDNRYERREKVHSLTRQGFSKAQIADVLGITTRTVERDRINEPFSRKKGRIAETGVVCPVCDRFVSINGNNYRMHTTEPGGPDWCPLGDIPLPVTEGTAWTYTHRRNQVARLAGLVQDSDPELVNAYLTSLTAREVQAIALFALAGIDVDRNRAELWPRWTRALVAP